MLTLFAGRVTCRKLGLINVVDSATFPRLTTDCVTKLLPLMFSVAAPLPAIAELGEVEVIFGVGLVTGLTTNVSARVVPPPGGGVLTVMLELPGAWISAAGIWAVSVFVLIKMTVRGVAFQLIVDAGVKL